MSRDMIFVIFLAPHWGPEAVLGTGPLSPLLKKLGVEQAWCTFAGDQICCMRGCWIHATMSNCGHGCVSLWGMSCSCVIIEYGSSMECRGSLDGIMASTLFGSTSCVVDQIHLWGHNFLWCAAGLWVHPNEMCTWPCQLGKLKVV